MPNGTDRVLAHKVAPVNRFSVRFLDCGRRPNNLPCRTIQVEQPTKKGGSRSNDLRVPSRPCTCSHDHSRSDVARISCREASGERAALCKESKKIEYSRVSVSPST